MGFFGRRLLTLPFLLALPRYIRLYVHLMRDGRVPLWPKLIVVFSLCYLISPLDFVPDVMVPVVGQLDDLLVLWLAFRTLVRLSPPEVVAEHLSRIGGTGR